MRATQKKISLNALELTDAWLQSERDQLSLIAESIHPEALKLFELFHPVFVVDCGDQKYRLIAGDAQVRLVRAIQGPNAKLTVRVLKTPDVDLCIAVERVVTPLALARSPGVILSGLKEMMHSGLINRLWRNRDRPASVKRLLNSLKGVAREVSMRNPKRTKDASRQSAKEEQPNNGG